MADYVLRVLVAEDDLDARTLMMDYLTHCGHTVWTACDGEEALACAEAHPLDVALLDVVMPGPSGMELIPQLQALRPGIIIILLTAYATIPQAVEAIQLGAFDYLEKPIQPKQVCAVVERAWGARHAQVQALQSLTDREREVLCLLAEGKSDADIAEIMSISARTVNAHMRKIFGKLGVENRVQAAILWNRYTGETPS
jgi:DNA-binding NarL/FixJ family response regulator